jgi:hypothetical protein
MNDSHKFDKKQYKVLEIPEMDTRPWVLKKHYARRRPSISYAFGLFRDNILVGVATFGNAIPMQMKWGICGKQFGDIVYELNRVVLNDDLPKNSASFLISRCLKMIGNPKIIVSYSDMAVNHHGYIYQACNFIYTGISHRQMDVKIRGKEHLHSRTIMDEFAFTPDRVRLLKEKYGDDLYYQMRPPKHRYVFFVGNKTEKKLLRKSLLYEQFDYPKGTNKKYDSSFTPETQQILF